MFDDHPLSNELRMTLCPFHCSPNEGVIPMNVVSSTLHRTRHDMISVGLSIFSCFRSLYLMLRHMFDIDSAVNCHERSMNGIHRFMIDTNTFMNGLSLRPNALMSVSYDKLSDFLSIPKRFCRCCLSITQQFLVLTALCFRSLRTFDWYCLPSDDSILPSGRKIKSLNCRIKMFVTEITKREVQKFFQDGGRVSSKEKSPSVRAKSRTVRKRPTSW